MWFKIDDKFPRHRKARAARRGHPSKRRDASPIGLWALAGAESDDGFIALEVLLDWDDEAEELAGRLVDAGLWFAAEKDGEQGFAFHDWVTHNPADASNAGSFGNHQRWHVSRGKVDEECVHCQAVAAGQDRGESHPMRVRRRGDIAPESLTRPDPTRPDPTRPEGTSLAHARATTRPLPSRSPRSMTASASGGTPTTTRPAKRRRRPPTAPHSRSPA